MPPMLRTDKPADSRSSRESVACLEPMLRRRQLLAASVMTLPLCTTLNACAGPNPLAGPPPLSPEVRALLQAVTAEQNLILVYKRTISSYSALAPDLDALLAEHQAHLTQLRARVIGPASHAPRTMRMP